MKTFCLSFIAALAFVSSTDGASFSSVTTYSQEQQSIFQFNAGLVTQIQGNLPMNIDLANVNAATSFRINASAMWYGTNFQALLGQDPKYKPGSTKATLTTPNGTVNL